MAIQDISQEIVKARLLEQVDMHRMDRVVAIIADNLDISQGNATLLDLIKCSNNQEVDMRDVVDME